MNDKGRRLIFEQLEQKRLLAVLFSEDFSNGIDPAVWEIKTTNEGKAEVANDVLKMYDTEDGGNYSEVSAIFSVDLEGKKDVFFSGSHFNYKDEAHSQDGVFVSNDAGVSWHKAVDFSLSTGDFSIDLDKIGLEYTDDFLIKLNQYDNYGLRYDGRGWDNLVIEIIPPPTPAALPYSQDFAAMPVDNWEFKSTNEGRINTVNGRLRMDDSVGNGTYSQNYAILHIEPTVHAELSGIQWNLKDETHSGDGVWTSSDGVTWTKTDVKLSSGSFSTILMPGTTQIRFGQKDNYPASDDGREWDDIRVEEVPPPPPPAWGFLFHVNGDNNLDSAWYPYVYSQLRRAAAENPNIAIAVQFDRVNSGASRIVYNRGKVSTTSIGEVNMGSQTVLTEFLDWGVGALPLVDNYAVMMVDHGGGWTGMSDDMHPRDHLTLPEMLGGFDASTVDADLIYFDACNMAEAEVVYQMRDQADIIVGAQTTGWVTSIYSTMKAVKETTSKEELGRIIVDHYANKNGGHSYTVSMVDASRVDDLADDMDDLADAIIATSDRSGVVSAFSSAKVTQYKTWITPRETSVDLGNLMKKLTSVNDPIVVTAATKVLDLLPSVVLHERHASSRNGVTGLSIARDRISRTSLKYDELEWSLDTSWDEISKHIPVPLPPPTVQTLPYSQTFDIMPGPDKGWEYYSTNEGRIQIVNGRLRMDDRKGNSVYSQNDAILHVDLAGKNNLQLTGYHKNISDELHPGDGIQVSADGTIWHDANIDLSSTGQFIIDLDQTINAAGIAYSSDFAIKFSQYDNYSSSSDGREWDNILIEEIVPPTPQVVTFLSPYMQEFDSKPSRAEGWEFVSTNDGRITFNGSMLMDDSVDGGSYSLNEAILHVNTETGFDVYLSGSYKNIKDEDHEQDGIFISSDGITWDKLDIKSGNFRERIPESVKEIKFSQYDNYGATKDGREFDSVKIELELPPDPSQPASWTVGDGYYKDLFIDGGVALSAKGTYAADFLGLSYQTLFTGSTSTQNSIMVSSATDLNGALLYPDGQPRFRMYYMNGGGSGDHVRSLKTGRTPDGRSGKDLVYEFFASGGSYTGSCAGAFAAGDKSWYYEIIPNTAFYKEMPWGVNVSAKFDKPEDQEFANIMIGLGFTTTVTSIPTYGGPIYRPGVDTLVGTDPVPGLKYFGRNTSGAGIGAPQVASYRDPNGKSGTATILSGHPEYKYWDGVSTSTVNKSNLGLMATVYAHALTGAKVVPDVKAVLQDNQTVSMTAVDEKIGDMQYHLYDIDATGKSTLDVTLTEASGNVDIYVQCGSHASKRTHIGKSENAGTADENISVALPANAGTCSIAVYGNHTNKNGEKYKLMVSTV